MFFISACDFKLLAYALSFKSEELPLAFLTLRFTSDILPQFLFIWKYFFLIYFFKRLFLRDRAGAGEGRRERETQNLKQAPGSELSAQSPTWGSNSQAVRSRPEPKLDT